MDIYVLYSLGYVGAFLAGVFSSVTVFLPTPGFLMVAAMAASKFFNPFLLGLFAGLGAAVGETISYGMAYGGEKLASRKYDLEKKLAIVRGYFQKYGAEVIIFVFAASPLPFDIIGLFCGVVNYPFKKFFAVTAAGKVVKYVLISYAAYYGIEFVAGWYYGLY